ncbi:MAG TPA: type 4a pilus biogenesis protein PilO [Candidatus Paceibacterota bacterium]
MKIITSVILIIAGGLLFYSLTVPALNEVKAVKVEIADYNEALQDSKSIQAKRDELLTSYNSISPADREKLDKFLPSSVSSIKFIVEVEDIVRRRGLLLKSIDIVEPKRSVETNAPAASESQEENFFPYGSIPVSITLSGSYSSFLSFLGDISKDLRLVDINNLVFTSGEKDSYEFNLKATTYYQK